MFIVFLYFYTWVTVFINLPIKFILLFFYHKTWAETPRKEQYLCFKRPLNDEALNCLSQRLPRMTPTSHQLFKSACSLIVCLAHMTVGGLAGTQFASHVSVSTPSRSFAHGVGDPLTILTPPGQSLTSSFRSVRRPSSAQFEHFGYPKVKPAIPFPYEDVVKVSPFRQNSYYDVDIPVLPPSPYKVNSPDPESLWPEGLFVPPRAPPRFESRRVDANNFLDPYLVEGSEAVAAVRRADHHGHFFFHDIPHIESLLANQDLRLKNNLKPHRIGSIRHTWPYNRP